MSTYDTGNAVPSDDPRDLDDNAKAFDRFLHSLAASEPDRLGVSRKTWHQMELDAAALVSPNVAALAAVSPAVDKGVFFNAVTPVGMGSYTLTSFSRSLGPLTDGTGYRAAIGAMALTDTGAYAGSAAKLTTPRTLAATGDGTWSVSFDGSANVTAALTLAASGVSAGTYGSVTVNAKGLVTAASVATPIEHGGTGQTTAAAALAALLGAPLASPTFTGVPAAPTPAVGVNTTQLATTAMVQAEIANKRTWTSYTPTIAVASGSYTTASATGKYMVAFGICHFQAQLTVTTKGTGASPSITAPFASLTGLSAVFSCRETAINGKAGVGTLLGNSAVINLGAYDNTDLVTANGCVVNISGSYPIA